ncbi:hypothetical protein COCSADRAFT_130537 [Bipolaris sorokiniana ND90Pr]|uniref:Uncharacterized protein n=1 Tax=Cochliobolus sativus (strain ND90Pr / ATCC 201652) TaxID=665912 RepID=M2TKC0_COCSN|nr:uncharacterized protein COCSADRAFT_130537 [Bipolaris sorokiniana ND90Pr]EMD69132.1 hypothetical protein COCSADRAFT_130537 [Bipolaris sorokiniana ND90Pr]
MSRVAKQNEQIREVLASVENGTQRINEMAKIRGWFRPKDGSGAYSAVQDYLNERIDLSETASLLFGPIDEKINSSHLDDVDFMDLWYSIIHSARRLSCRENAESHNHDKLVDLIKAFKEHSIPNNEIYNYLYSEMTDFGMACREAYNDAPVAHDGFFDQEVEAWANMNFFYARVTQKGLQDLWIYAIWSMRTALETPLVDDPSATANQQYDAYVPAAAAWIFGNGRQLFRLEKDLTPADPKQGNPARGGELWKGKAEFSKDRWALWKERFAAVGKMDGVTEKTRITARDAVESMERSETYEPMPR